MQLSDLNIDNTRQYMVDVHGKRYAIKRQRGRYYIQHAKGQLTVTALVNQSQSDCVFNYIFEGGFQNSPCPAMDYWIERHRLKKIITPAAFASKHSALFVYFKPVNYSS